MGVGSATQQEQEPVWEVIQDMASKVNNCSIKRFVSNQLATWTLAAENFMALKKVCVKEVELNGLTVRLQFNPARIVSSAAKLGKEDILKRRCFLCGKNRPKEQRWIDFVTATGHEYHILVNPYPIFPEHLVIALADHSDQAISGRFEDMLALSEALHGRTIFYNGPKSGASAPDHHHFQAALNGLMPLQNDVESCPRQGVLLAEYNDANLYHYNKFSPGIFVINSKSAASASSLFYRLLDCADTPDGDVEPRINLYSWWTGEEFRVIVYFRRCHRSHHYFSLGEDHLTMSPGCADMAGVFIVPVKEEYDRITAELLGEMISEVTIPKEEQARIIERLTRTQPALSVGIMSAEEIRFEIFADGKAQNALDLLLHGNRIFEVIVSLMRMSGAAECSHPLYETEEDLRLTLARQFVIDNINLPLTVADLASYCNLSEKQLTRLFLQYEGSPPKQYIQRQKVNKMEQLLADHTLSLKEISEQMHFSSEYYFNSYFKKHFGMPPGMYRKMYKKEHIT